MRVSRLAHPIAFLSGLLFLPLLLVSFRVNSLSAEFVGYRQIIAQQTPTTSLYLPFIPQHPTDFPFVLQNGQPTYIQNFANTAGCNWMGIAGQAFDLYGHPIIGLIVHIEGSGLNYDVFTGDPRFSAYGPGGYELYLGSTPINTTDVYRIQVRTQAGVPRSDFYFIPTFADCRRNLAIANFVPKP
jgi:hypothetical protein